MDHFTVTQPLPDVFHIQDAGQVCFTLIRGETSTLLFDTGMGFYNVAECIAPYARGELHVILSHGHYDHACGQHYFSESFVHPDDWKLCQRSISRKFRQATLNRLRPRGFLEDNYPSEQFVNGTPDTVKPLKEMSIDLGNLAVQFLPAPGHTKGSIVAVVDRYSLLLTGDTWNPHTWLFFPESQSLAVYTSTLRQLRNLLAEHVLRPHDVSMVSMAQFQSYIDGLDEETIQKAEPCPVPPYTNIRTYCCCPEPGSKLVFNADKLV